MPSDACWMLYSLALLCSLGFGGRFPTLYQRPDASGQSSPEDVLYSAASDVGPSTIIRLSARAQRLLSFAVDNPMSGAQIPSSELVFKRLKLKWCPFILVTFDQRLSAVATTPRCSSYVRGARVAVRMDLEGHATPAEHEGDWWYQEGYLTAVRFRNDRRYVELRRILSESHESDIITFARLQSVIGDKNQRRFRPRGAAETVSRMDATSSDIFRSCSDWVLPVLTRSSNPNVSVLASWERLCRSLVLPGRAHTYSKDKFIELVEKRLQLKVPKIWADGLKYLTIRKDGSVHLDFPWTRNINGTTVFDPRGNPLTTIAALYPNSRVQNGRVISPAEASLKCDIRGWQIDQGSQSIFIPRRSIETVQDHANHIAVKFSSKHAFVVTSDRTFPDGFPVGCFRRDSGKNVWTARVGAAGYNGFWEGAGFHYVRITDSGRHVCVFGVSFTGLYVEQFRKRDGARLLRFNTVDRESRRHK